MTIQMLWLVSDNVAASNMKLMIHIVMSTQLITIIKSDDKKPLQIIVIVIDDLGKKKIGYFIYVLNLFPNGNNVS
jgi:hypothetical protein